MHGQFRVKFIQVESEKSHGPTITVTVTVRLGLTASVGLRRHGHGAGETAGTATKAFTVKVQTFKFLVDFPNLAMQNKC